MGGGGSLGGPIGGLLGLNGGVSGTGISGPTGASITNYVDPNQVSNALDNTNYGLNQQRRFLESIQGQNGLGNQSSVFNQQQALANQLQQNALGQGPNPAQAALAQQTAANTANQAALMAGQRGAGANAGLIARQAAQQGAMNQQNSIGQMATLQAQQQLSAQQQLGAQQQAMQGVAANQIGNQSQSVGNFNNFAQSQQQNLLNSGNAFNNAAVGNQGNVNTNNSNIARQSMAGQQSILNGGGSALGLLAFSGGGIVDDGSKVLSMADAPNEEPIASKKPSSQAKPAGHPQGTGSGYAGSDNMESAQMTAAYGGQAGFYKSNPKLSKVSDKARMKLPDHLQGLADIYHKGHEFKNPMNASNGVMVPGKAEVKGDSPKNDKIKALLSPGEIVIPRSVIQSSDPAGGAAKFVEKIMAKHGGGSEHKDFKSALSNAIKARRKK